MLTLCNFGNSVCRQKVQITMHRWRSAFGTTARTSAKR